MSNQNYYVQYRVLYVDTPHQGVSCTNFSVKRMFSDVLVQTSRQNIVSNQNLLGTVRRVLQLYTGHSVRTQHMVMVIPALVESQDPRHPLL